MKAVNHSPTQSMMASPDGDSLPASHWLGLMMTVLLVGLAWINLSRIPAEKAAADRSLMAVQVGFLAPDFTLPTLEGETVTLSELRGHPVVLNFWATWCPPCRAEMPALEAAWQKYAAQGVLIFGVNQGEQPAAVQRYARGIVNTSFPLLLDQRTTVGRLYMVRALPTTVFIDAEGRIQDIRVGGPLNPASILDGLRKVGSVDGGGS